MFKKADIHFLKKFKKKKSRKVEKNFYFSFFKIAQKRCQGGRTLSTLSTFSKCFWRGWSIRGCWKKDNNKKKSDNFYFFYFFKLPPKRCPGGRRLHPQPPQSVECRGWSRRGRWKFTLKTLDGVHLFCSTQLTVEGCFSSQLISEYYWNQTTTLIPFLQAITNFCNCIPSYFMERFTFLIDDNNLITPTQPDRTASIDLEPILHMTYIHCYAYSEIIEVNFTNTVCISLSKAD